MKATRLPRAIRKVFSYKRALGEIDESTFVAGIALAEMANALALAYKIAEQDKLDTKKIEELVECVTREADTLLGSEGRIFKAAEVQPLP